MRRACRLGLLFLASATAAIAGQHEAAAACINVTTGLPVNLSQPTSNQTVVCDTNSPNPAFTAISAVAGSTNVTVTVQNGSSTGTAEPSWPTVKAAICWRAPR